MKGTHGEAEQDHVHDKLTQEIGKLVEAGNPPKAGLLKTLGSAPIVIHEPDEAIPQFRLRFDLSCDADGPRIGPHDEDVSQIPAVNPELPQSIPEEETAGHRKNGADHPNMERKRLLAILMWKKKERLPTITVPTVVALRMSEASARNEDRRRDW